MQVEKKGILRQAQYDTDYMCGFPIGVGNDEVTKVTM